jgi:predicted dehydrogenase
MTDQGAVTSPEPIGVAVLGAGMAGRAHAAAYRTAATLYGLDRPAARLVAVADPNRPLAEDVARRYGYQRAETGWQAVAAAPDVDAVSVAAANYLHREMAEGLLAAGKHVLCEKPLAASYADAQAMTAAAEASGLVAAVGYTYRRSPAISAVGQLLAAGELGEIIQFSGRYWEDYALDPGTPLSWRYQGGTGSGALADLGSHLVDIAEQLCGPIAMVGGAMVHTAVTERPVPTASTVGHGHAEATGQAGPVRADTVPAGPVPAGPVPVGPVENEDAAVFTARFGSGAAGSFSVSRVAHGQPDGLGFEVFGTAGSAAFDLHRMGEFSVSTAGPRPAFNGPRRVLVGPDHPYVQDGLPMVAGGVGYGTGDMFAYQARAFLDQISGSAGLPPCADFRAGLHGIAVLDAVARSARAGGVPVPVG